MLSEWLALFPPWLLVGLFFGAMASVFAAGVFVVGGRLFPTAPVDESERVDGTTRRRAEIREYLAAIGEPFAEDHPVHGQTVAFYLPSRDVAITFDAQAYFRIERAGTYAVLCEHEMPGAQLGRRLPFEVPELEPELADLDDPIAEAFERLGLPATASADDVKAAYRAQVKRAHPDHGGDEVAFKRVREAYTTAKDHAEA
ncbi:J domain-containing protein [Haloprofundus sp. MHR1]|uniref:J domain-containing protein n=1 Tax=Haloprofundus sp. MHR1 TaxID=2572921 RepID=UPI0010BF06DD|nr:J domain-containing protein [Haloprofundus sp. MHR1]QCJ47629.1 J domain-containing protein [Haloprofundus sp. MHR1]